MHLKTIRINDFRNLKALTLPFHPQFNFIYGKNGQGKTNIMEAIYYLSVLKSFRTSERTDLIGRAQDFAKIDAVFEKDDLSWDISIVLTAQDRQILLNGKKPAARKTYHELIPLILFEPRHIYLFRDSPTGRRQYLNRATFLQDAAYLQDLLDYEKVISQKNRLLKERRDDGMLDIYDEQIAALGARLMLMRLFWFKEINAILAFEYKAIAQMGEALQLVYKPGQNLGEGLISSDSTSATDLKNLLLEKIAEKKNDERERRESIVGPHRDDFSALLGDRDLGDFGSQGENRSAIIALKMAQLKVFAQKYNKTPLFLLDDVASELDENRCEALFSYLRDSSTQVFITTTEHRIGGAHFQGRSKSFLVERGQVSEMENQ